MDIVYYVSGTLMSLLIVAIIVAGIALLIKPTLSRRITKRTFLRRHILAAAFVSLLVVTIGFGTVLGVTEPESVRQSRIETQRLEDEAKAQAERDRQQTEREAEARRTQVKTEVKHEAITFTSENREDGSIPKGETRVGQEGVAGEKQLTYLVTYKDGVEVGRELSGEVVTKEPIVQVTLVGTYVAPAPVSTPAPAATNAAPAQSTGIVKLSNNGICHAPGTTYYSRTKNFTGFSSLQECLNAGGRMPLR